MSDYKPTDAEVRHEYVMSFLVEYQQDASDEFDRWLAEHDAKVRAGAIREYVAAARENPHTLYWPPSGVLDDAEQWAEEIEKGTI